MKLNGWRSATMATVSLVMVGLVNAETADVPANLPHFKAIQVYQNYLKKKVHSAFAVSEHGAFAATFGEESLNVAKDMAIQECEALQLGAPCEIVSENGKATGKTIDIKNLKGKFRDAQGRIWPAVEDGVVPQLLATDETLYLAYFDYVKKRGFKAFAASETGAWGFSSGHVDHKQASQVALSQCKIQLEESGNCQIVDINNEPLSPVVNINYGN